MYYNNILCFVIELKMEAYHTSVHTNTVLYQGTVGRTPDASYVLHTSHGYATTTVVYEFLLVEIRRDRVFSAGR
jgi:hypothetical protein